ncbi:MAG: hypothetical protein U5N86_04780 [Planctomycetota bacterium]|nr:hypothetical protein [Planctomycetota bacterium]
MTHRSAWAAGSRSSLEADGKIVEILPRGGVFNEPVPPIDYDHRNWGL